MSERDLQNRYDAIVVGSGASGGWAAKELSERSLSVLVLEAGRPIVPGKDYSWMTAGKHRNSPAERIKAMMAGQYVQAWCGGWSPLTKHFFVNDRLNPYTYPRDQKYYWFRGRQAGGRLHTWARVAPRMSDADFQAAKGGGHGRDWPISYADLQPYYDRVETFMGLYGEKDGHPLMPDGIYIRPWPLTSQETAFKHQIERTWPERRVVSARVMQQLSRVPIMLLSAQQTGRCEMRYHAIVSKIDIDSRTRRATGVTFIDRYTGRTQTVQSRVIVLAASAFESIRILLNSRCREHPGGIGNSSGLLGRNVMDNTFLYRSGPTEHCDPPPFDQDPYALGKGNGFFIPQFRNVNGLDSDFLRGYYTCGAIGRGGKRWWMVCFGAMLPHPENRVTVHPKMKDAWGIPVIHIDIRYRENELAMIADQEKTLQEMIAACGLKVSCWVSGPCGPLFQKVMENRSLHPSGSFYPGYAVHKCGGAPMGSDPGESILNMYSQSWDVDNVYVTDAACFPSGAAVNLTNTIMALTVRACEHIADRMHGGEL
ncbi:GMC oxidoreductase [Desulfococcus sp.]|uniref:GMC oxidoreductase n=1 Tax=Desulfococcus sp. TaxID=2025834 RepID=UPI003593A5D5